MRLVIALGGNAIAPRQHGGHAPDRHAWALLEQTCQEIAALIRDGHAVVLVHGNGPQVGALLLQNEAARELVPLSSLDECVAETQGQLGYIIEWLLGNALADSGAERTVVSLVTQVVVEATDPAFRGPTKPIGHFYTGERAVALAAEEGLAAREVRPGQWRRVVPSPRPLRLVEMRAIATLAEAGMVLVVAGGGGVPVIERGGRLEGVEAVIDKDYAAELVAIGLKADVLFVLTDVDAVYLDYDTPQARPLAQLSVENGWRHPREHQFPPGSMGPKVLAARRFVEAGGQRAVIAALPHASAALHGRAGTQFTWTTPDG